MDKKRKGFTITWHIKKASFLSREKGKGITSASFVVDTMGNTQWNIGMLVCPTGFDRCLAFYLIRGKGGECTEEIALDFELSVLARDGTTLVSADTHKLIFGIDEWSPPLVLEQDDLKQNMDVFLPDDVLTVRCRMWRNGGSVLEDGRCFAVTKFPVSEVSFVGVVDEFNDLRPAQSKAIRIRTASTKKQPFSMNISKDRRGIINVEIVSAVKDLPCSQSVCKCKLFIVDVVGNRMKCGEEKFLFSFNDSSQISKFPLSVTVENLMQSKKIYLPNNSLTIQCEFAFTIGFVFNEVEKTEYSTTLFADNRPAAILGVEDVNISEKAFEPSPVWKDLLSFYRRGVLCDATLHAGSESFKVHSLILRIRSSVFSDMLSQNEAGMADLHVADTDGVSLRHMLDFMYGDTLVSLDWETATKLYVAACRYGIVPLKGRCSTFLKHNLHPSNVCDALLLAYQHQDDHLKKAAQSCVSTNHKRVILSDRWKSLEENYPALMLETFRMIYLKKWQNF